MGNTFANCKEDTVSLLDKLHGEDLERTRSESEVKDEENVSFVDEDGDAVKFAIEGSKLIKYANGSKSVGEDDTSGVVTGLTITQGRPFDVRDQYGWGSPDYPEKVVAWLRANAPRLSIAVADQDAEQKAQKAAKEQALMSKHGASTIEEAQRKEAEEKARQVQQWAAARQDAGAEEWLQKWIEEGEATPSVKATMLGDGWKEGLGLALEWDIDRLNKMLERLKQEEEAAEDEAKKEGYGFVQRFVKDLIERKEKALMRKHGASTIEEAQRKEAEEKARQVKQWAAATEAKAPSIQQWTDAAVLVVLREAIPKLKDLEGWGSLTEGSELRTKGGDGLDKYDAVFVDDEGRSHELEGIIVDGKGRVYGIELAEKGLEGTIPECIAKLDKLMGLDIYDNRLSGRLPDGMGSAKCNPALKVLRVHNNPGLSGEVCMELFRKKGVNLEVWGTSVRTPFFYGTTVASQTIPTVMFATGYGGVHKVLCQDGRAQDPVPTVRCDSGYDKSGREPAHRCELDGKGSHNEVAKGKYERAKADPNDPEGKATGSHYNPWQPIWGGGLDTLGKRGEAKAKAKAEFEKAHPAGTAKIWNEELQKWEQSFEKAKYPWGDETGELVDEPEQEDIYVVCWTEGEYGGMEDPFKQKLHQPNVEKWLGSGQTKWVYDDFDPKYGLEGDEASSILDWERRMIVKAAAKYPDGLRVRYIDPEGDEDKATDEPPAWYCAKPTDGSGPQMWYGDDNEWL